MTNKPDSLFEVVEPELDSAKSLFDGMTSKETATLTAYYLSTSRVLSLLGHAPLPLPVTAALRGGDVVMASAVLAHAVGGYILDQIQARKVRTLDELAFSGQLQHGTQFIYEGYATGKGFGVSKSTLCELKRKLDGPLDGKKLVVEFSKDGLTSDTAYARLSGRIARIFIYGYIFEVCNNIPMIPYVIGDLVSRNCGLSPYLAPSLEVRPEEVEQFSKIDVKWSPRDSELRHLKKIPERQIKELICRLLGEHDVPADWGGEQCDVFTANLLIAGKRLKAAFLLKGPSNFSTMRPTHLGKNGDQIYRLTQVPADIFVVQHCQGIGAAVRHQLESASLQRSFVSPTRFMFMDGVSTAQLLKAYGEWPDQLGSDKM